MCMVSYRNSQGVPMTRGCGSNTRPLGTCVYMYVQRSDNVLTSNQCDAVTDNIDIDFVVVFEKDFFCSRAQFVMKHTHNAL